MDEQSSIFIHPRPLIDHFPNDYQADRVVYILKTFLKDMDFVPTGINPTNKAVEDHMESLMNDRGIESERLKRIIHVSASLIELGYHNCTLDEKINLALYNWFGIYIDDCAPKDPIPFREFGSRLLQRQPQLDPVLTAFTEVLNRLWDFYDPISASIILNQTLNFTTACCIEPELEKIPLKHGIERFPWYIRDLTGIAVGYSLFMFVKSGNFDIMQVIQALPDMNFWVAATNDLLSFHKEEITSETGTYIYNRARTDNKSRYETCSEIVTERKQARENIYAILEDNSAATKTWKIWETGYVEWHIGQNQRYHLEDLGITISSCLLGNPFLHRK